MRTGWLSLGGALAALLVACGAQKSRAVRMESGRGMVLCFERKYAVWAAVRSDALERVEGWGRPVEPALIAFPFRGRSPVIVPLGQKLHVAWLDGDVVVEAVCGTTGERGFVLPAVPVTGALVLPEAMSLPLVAKDRVRVVVEGRHGN